MRVIRMSELSRAARDYAGGYPADGLWRDIPPSLQDDPEDSEDTTLEEQTAAPVTPRPSRLIAGVSFLNRK